MGATPRGPMRFETAAIHAGQDPDAPYGAVNVPIYQTSTYAQPSVGKPKVFDYARGGNPTRAAFQTALAALEGGERCLRVRERDGRGVDAAALAAARAITCCSPTTSTAGRTGSCPRCSSPGACRTRPSTSPTSTRFAEPSAPQTRVVWLETPSNPMLKIVDIEAVAPAAHEAGARVVVDNTFATPALQRPLELGADAVVHSVTKYIGGHSDLIGGAVVTSDPEWIERLGFLVNAVGAVPGRWTRYLAPPRAEDARHPDGEALRERRGDRGVALHRTRRSGTCTTRGLESHPGHDVAAPADVGVRRDGLVRGRVRRGGDRDRGADRAVLPRGVARRRGVADRGPGADDARERRGIAARGAAGARPPVRRDRARRRPDRRSRPGARASAGRSRSPPRSATPTACTRGSLVHDADRRVRRRRTSRAAEPRPHRPRPMRSPRPSTRCSAGAAPGWSSAGTSHEMKNGSQRSSPRSSIPAPRQRTSVPSGRVRAPGWTVEAQPGRRRVDVVVGETHREPAVAVRGQLHAASVPSTVFDPTSSSTTPNSST